MNKILFTFCFIYKKTITLHSLVMQSSEKFVDIDMRNINTFVA